MQKTCSKASRFQIITEAEKELLQRKEADANRKNKRKPTKFNIKENEKGKQRKWKQRKNQQKRRKGRLKNKSGKKQHKKKNTKEREKARNTQSRSHKQNLLQHVLDIEEKTRGRQMENDETESESESEKPNDNATNFEKTQNEPVLSNKEKQEKRQKEKKKKDKQKVRKKKCKYTKRDLEAKNEKTCNRAKERAKLSYKTMDLLFEQIFDESLIFSKVTKREKVYSRFFRAAEAFVSNNTVCDGNPAWNSVLLMENLSEFKENIDELAICFLGQKLTNNDGRGETFDQNSVGLSKSDREGLENCLETQNKTERCAHCSNKCGEALKNGEICVQRAVRLLEKARRSRDSCQNQFRKLDKMQQRLVHDMYR